MATGDVFQVFTPREFIPQNGTCFDPTKVRQVGPYAGYALRKLAADGFYLVAKIPLNGTPVPTGVTVRITTVDDPNNSDVGKVYRLEVSGAKLVSGTTNITTVPMGTVTTSDVTAAATAGIVTTTALAITTANLNTPVAGNEIVLFIRRVGTHVNDTHGGCPLVVAVSVTDT